MAQSFRANDLILYNILTGIKYLTFINNLIYILVDLSMLSLIEVEKNMQSAQIVLHAYMYG